MTDGTSTRVTTRFDIHGMGRFTVELNQTHFGLRLDHDHSNRVMLMGLPKTQGWRAITPVHLAHQSYIEKVEDWLEEVVWPRQIAALEVDTGTWQIVWEGGVIGGERQSWLPRHVKGCKDCRSAVAGGRFDRCSECQDVRERLAAKQSGGGDP